MAVKFDRMLDGFDGPFEEIKDLVVPPPPARVVGRRERRRLLPEPACQRLVPGREPASEGRRGSPALARAGTAVGASRTRRASFFITRKPTTLPLLEKIAAELGTPFRGSTVAPGKEAVRS